MSDAADIQRDQELAASPEDAATAAARELLKDVHTSLPGIVESFDATTQTASVRPAIRRVWVEQGPMDLPKCVDVPVFCQAGGGFVLTMPPVPGDECLLCFSERAIDEWFAHGGVQNPSEYRLHDYSDAFAFVGFSSKPRAIGLFATDAAELRTRDGTTVLRIEKGTVFVGAKVGAEKGPRWESYRQGETLMHKVLLSALQAAGAAPTSGTDSPFTLALKAMLPIWVAALETFEDGAEGYLAQKAKLF